MTPSAITPAARGSSPEKRSAAPPKQRAAGHRSTVRKPTVPRRISGPSAAASSPAAGVSSPAAGVSSPARRVPTRPAPTRPAPTRRPRRPARRRAARPVARGSLLVRARALVTGLPDHPLLDRIIRGRAWIPILGILLAGIVAMQVEVLKLSATTGRSIERGTALASRNEQLRASVAELSDDQRIESLAASMGMVMPAPEAINFLHVRGGDAIGPALHNIHAPDASGFVAALPVIDTPSGAAAAAADAGTTPGATTAVTPTTGETTATGDTTATATATAATSTGG